MSLFNLLPPQLLVATLKQYDYKVEWFKQDDLKYVLQYAVNDKKMLKISVDNQKMFTLWAQFGFDAFTCKPCGVLSIWNGFPSSNLIPEDDSLPDNNSREISYQKTREPEIDKVQTEHTIVDENPREPEDIPLSVDDFTSDTLTPIASDFTLPPETGINIEEYPAIALVHRKQHKLADLQDRFGHLMFLSLN